jgi:hypothetical protein
VDAGELQCGLGLVVLAPGAARLLQRLLLEILRLGQTSLPARNPSTPIERREATLVVAGLDDRERLVRELDRTHELAVE